MIHCFEENNNKQPATKHRRTLKIMHFAPNLPSKGESVGGGGHFAYEKSGDARRKFWIKPPKGDRSGRGSSFFWPLKETMLKHRQYIYFYIFSRATLDETFTSKYDGVCPEHPKWDRNPKFTPLSETSSIPTPFQCGVPLPGTFQWVNYLQANNLRAVSNCDYKDCIANIGYGISQWCVCWGNSWIQKRFCLSLLKLEL